MKKTETETETETGNRTGNRKPESLPDRNRPGGPVPVGERAGGESLHKDLRSTSPQAPYQQRLRYLSSTHRISGYPGQRIGRPANGLVNQPTDSSTRWIGLPAGGFFYENIHLIWKLFHLIWKLFLVYQPEDSFDLFLFDNFFEKCF